MSVDPKVKRLVLKIVRSGKRIGKTSSEIGIAVHKAKSNVHHSVPRLALKELQKEGKVVFEAPTFHLAAYAPGRKEGFLQAVGAKGPSGLPYTQALEWLAAFHEDVPFQKVGH